MRKILIILAVAAIAAAIILCVYNSNSDSRHLKSEIAALEEEYEELKAELDTAKSDLEAAGLKIAELEDENTALQSELDYLKSNLEAAVLKIAALEDDLNDIFNGDQSQLRDPTWAELERFVKTDKTDTLEYILNEFDCEGFTITLRDHAWRRGFRSGYVAIGLGEENNGHVLNAFQTTDEGLIYIDNSEQDTIGYIQIGQVYGTIALDGVKETYIDCSMPPDQFWKPITYSHYTGNLFSYDYYENYASRDEFYTRSTVAYNEEVADYNSAANSFNQGGNAYSHSELEAWSDRLDSWSANLDKLVEDLGSVRIEPMGTVRNIEIYWN